ncbi:mutated in bladder cancer 1 [Holotrichia oblita]|uniref:Mutated in bladder cancer 1 n=1 Tax=Holotrichia oblita TaxID=644536 RepID=A0ACB9TLC3_HOLOL|nr:mutated in bladder cancer 1 [Holotrichia oblita]
MTSTFLIEINKLKNIQTNLEKTEQILLEYLHKHGLIEVIDFYDNLEIERKKEINFIQTEIINMLTLLNKFKSLPTTTEKEHLDYKRTKREMILLAENIKHLHHKTNDYIEKLKQNEKKFHDDVRHFEYKIGEWEKHASLVWSNPNRANEKIDENISSFLTFLSQHGGHSNGWSSDDHNLFLKARSRCRNIEELCTYLHSILPDVSEEEIELHEKWYLKYLELKEKQKEAIKIWRKAKSAVVTQQKVINNTTIRVASAYNQTKRVSRHEIKEKLEKWKQEKLQKIQQESILNHEAEKQKKEIEYKDKLKHDEIKRAIDNWKLAKLEKEELQLHEKHILEKKQRLFKSAMANRLIKEFQIQDAVFVRRRIETCKPKIGCLERVANTVHATRDPSRLLRPTKQWISRIKSCTGDSTPIKNSTTIKTIQRLGMPEWRKGVAASR